MDEVARKSASPTRDRATILDRDCQGPDTGRSGSCCWRIPTGRSVKIEDDRSWKRRISHNIKERSGCNLDHGCVRMRDGNLFAQTSKNFKVFGNGLSEC